jgi:hypothetical protein
LHACHARQFNPINPSAGALEKQNGMSLRIREWAPMVFIVFATLIHWSVAGICAFTMAREIRALDHQKMPFRDTVVGSPWRVRASV